MLKFSRLLLAPKKLSKCAAFRIHNCYLSSIYEENSIEYLLALDFEATCDKVKPPNYVQEIIEFPCIKFNLMSLKEEGRFHRYVKPVINSKLTNFCVELTGILQEMVDGENTFTEVLEMFEQWRVEEGLTKENSLYITSGDWDLGHMMPSQCFHYNTNVPDHMREWIDIKRDSWSFEMIEHPEADNKSAFENFTRVPHRCYPLIFAYTHGRYLPSFREILEFYKLKFQGRRHSGIDDALNMCPVIEKLIRRGAQFKPTSRLHQKSPNINAFTVQHYVQHFVQ